MEKKQIVYNDTVVRQFVFASVFWGIVAMLVGVLIASQMAYYKMNFDIPWLQFGRLRPLHTNAAIFAFVGNMLFAGIYHSSQRLFKARMASDFLSKLHFWGWQLIIVAAALTLPLGITQGKEYAELEWPIDIMITIVWVAFAVNFFWTMAKRNEKNLYVAIWFYIASIVTVAVLHLVNSLVLPLDLFKSYSVYAGVQDALVQWWYGHNAVAFFLTTPILGIMYYYMPKAAERPIYSYRLSVIHFWALVFLYIWAGPHHLLNTALPVWAQSLGMVFSIALWAPSWGGMINGLLTLRGAWDKLRTDPVIKFFVAGITFYGMSTFEGPMMAIKTVNGLAHYTDWIISHVHGGTLGWNGFMAAGMFYWLVPRLYGTKLFSKKMANLHFWVGLVGILLYLAAMYTSGINQGLMWRALTAEGTLLYPNFLEAITASRIMYVIRMIGGILYVGTFILMGYNLIKTARSGQAVDGVVEVTVPERKPAAKVTWARILLSPTFIIIVLGLALLLGLGTQNVVQSFLVYAGFAVILVASLFLKFRKSDRPGGMPWHEAIEGKAFLFSVFVVFAVLIGGAVEILPMVLSKTAAPMPTDPTPYTPLELEGRDIYIREGCYVCHSQMVRPMVAETLRYGLYSQSWEYKYDHPFQWGSKRTGPDLHRVGGKYPNIWHYKHLMNPRSTSPGSLMPNYPFLADRKVDFQKTGEKIVIMQKLGVPYKDKEIFSAEKKGLRQGKRIVSDLESQGVQVAPDSEMVALISYLQKLGVDRKQRESENVEAAAVK